MRKQRIRTGFAAAGLLLGMTFVVPALTGVAVNLVSTEAQAAAPCDEATKQRLAKTIDEDKQRVEIAQADFTKQQITNANSFLQHGFIEPAFDRLLREKAVSLKEWQQIADKDRAAFAKCFGYEPPSLQTTPPTLKSGTKGQGEVAPAKLDTSKMTEAVANDLTFQNNTGTRILLKAPADYHWIAALHLRRRARNTVTAVAGTSSTEKETGCRVIRTLFSRSIRSRRAAIPRWCTRTERWPGS